MESTVALRLPVDRRKPPLCHQLSHRSSVINLDKNRIRHARRLMPRPLSLPSGFNLMRQLGISNGVNSDAEKKSHTVDLSEIKQLEDDIYDRKRTSASNAAGRPKSCRLGADCSKCNKHPMDLKRVSAASQAILLLDAWQKEPLLQKYSKSIPNVSPNEGPNTKSRHIVETNPLNLQTKQMAHPQVSKIEPIVVKRRPKTSSPMSKRSSKSVFYRCISPDTSTDTEQETCVEGHLPNKHDEADIGKLNRFKRFIMNRRSLNLSRQHDTPPLSVSSSSAKDRLSIDVLLSDKTIISTPQHAETPTTSSAPIYPAQHVGSLRRRQWRSDDDIYETMDFRRNRSNRQTGIGCNRQDIEAKIVDLERMQEQLDQLSVDLANRRRMLLEGDSGYAKADLKKQQRSPSMLLLWHNNQKRHSIGSPTDLVKTWEYRRRYFIIYLSGNGSLEI